MNRGAIMSVNLRRLLWTATLAWISTTGGAAVAGETLLTIGTGSTTGVYHQIGASVCRFLRIRHQDHNLICRTRGSNGSVDNLLGLRWGNLDLAIVQSDLQHHAYNGTSVFERQRPNKDLRALFSVVPETFSVVVRESDDISEFSDLKGRRVNIGAPGSGQRVVMKSLMSQLGWSTADFEAATEFPSALQAVQVCGRRIDAAIYVVAHPNPAVQGAVRACDSVLVPVTGLEIKDYITSNPYFIETTISANTYRSIPDPVPSFGVVATVLATSDTPSETVYHVVKAVFENLEEMRRLLPVFANLDREFMLSPHHTSPWHPGALKYFKEAGLM